MTYVRVGGIDIPVKYDDELTDFGEYSSYPACQIRLSSELSDPLKTMTLIHEVIHAVSDQYSLEFSERTVRVLETAITQLIRDNPVFVQTTLAVLGD